MAVAISEKTAPAAPAAAVAPALSTKAREMMEQLNADAAKLNIWVRTQANSPAQRPWFTDTNGASAQQLTEGRVGVGRLKTLPYHWAWKEYRPYLDRISEIARKADVSPIEFADRQSILLTNPGLQGRLQVTNTIRCAISIYNPGDLAPAHLHSPNASRTILSEKGGYTNVEGERCEAARGDLILTPNGTWHDHGNESGQPVVWIDMLDWPLIEFLDCAWVDHDFQGANGGSNAKSQPTTHEDGYSDRLYGLGGVIPGFVSHQRGSGRDPAPLVHFRGAQIRDMLHKLRGEVGDPYEGINVSFVNPVTGAPVFKTLHYGAQLIRSGEETQLKRETCSTFHVVIEGSGTTEIGGKRFDWEENDIFVVPNFTWRKHMAKKDAVIYSVSDAALLKNIGQYYAQGRLNDGSVRELA
ncbi:MAG TPA: cupin domain-containing protein [Xanthobacteraceae bacterium]